MYKKKSLVLVAVLVAVSCTNGTSHIKEEKQLSQQSEYVIDDSLSANFYVDLKGYVPTEGFVPTADVAVKIAQCVLFEIYGKESIEKEMPFSVNLENGVWIIEGNLKTNDTIVTFGGESYMEIKKSNGEILKLLHTK